MSLPVWTYEAVWEKRGKGLVERTWDEIQGPLLEVEDRLVMELWVEMEEAETSWLLLPLPLMLWT